jgi:hypothetical protein
MGVDFMTISRDERGVHPIPQAIAIAVKALTLVPS